MHLQNTSANFLYLFIHSRNLNCNCFTWKLTNKQEKTTEETEAEGCALMSSRRWAGGGRQWGGEAGPETRGEGGGHTEPWEDPCRLALQSLRLREERGVSPPPPGGARDHQMAVPAIFPSQPRGDEASVIRGTSLWPVGL